MEHIDVVVMIGNSDDRLSQFDWYSFSSEFARLMSRHEERRHGLWYSHPSAPWQNMAICAEVDPENFEDMVQELRKLAAAYGQDSIAILEGTTQFVTPEKK